MRPETRAAVEALLTRLGGHLEDADDWGIVRDRVRDVRAALDGEAAEREDIDDIAARAQEVFHEHTNLRDFGRKAWRAVVRTVLDAVGASGGDVGSFSHTAATARVAAWQELDSAIAEIVIAWDASECGDIEGRMVERLKRARDKYDPTDPVPPGSETPHSDRARGSDVPAGIVNVSNLKPASAANGPTWERPTASATPAPLTEAEARAWYGRMIHRLFPDMDEDAGLCAEVVSMLLAISRHDIPAEVRAPWPPGTDTAARSALSALRREDASPHESVMREPAVAAAVERVTGWRPTPGARVVTAESLTDAFKPDGVRRPNAAGTVVEKGAQWGWWVQHDDGTQAPYNADELRPESGS